MILLDKPREIREFEDYLTRIVEPLTLGKEEKAELREEWLLHLTDSMNDLMQHGMPEKEAIEHTIKQFGEAELLQAEVKKSYSSSLKRHLLKELLIWGICLIAMSIGPGLLINAHYQLYFIIWPLILLVLCYGIYHVIVKRISFPALWFVGVLLFYGTFVYFICQRFSAEYYVQNIISLKWDELTGGDGIFSEPSLHLLWFMIIAFVLTFSKNKKRQWLSVVQSSFEYWAMVMAGLNIVVTETLTNSGEGKVILLNIFLLYGFLQQAIDLDFLVKSMNKVKHWVKGF